MNLSEAQKRVIQNKIDLETQIIKNLISLRAA